MSDNRETWAVHMHLSNVEPLYREAREIIRRYTEVSEGTNEYFVAAEKLEEWVREAYDNKLDRNDPLIGMLTDMDPLSRVDWIEVCRVLNDE